MGFVSGCHAIWFRTPTLPLFLRLPSLSLHATAPTQGIRSSHALPCDVPPYTQHRLRAASSFIFRIATADAAVFNTSFNFYTGTIPAIVWPPSSRTGRRNGLGHASVGQKKGQGPSSE